MKVCSQSLTGLLAGVAFGCVTSKAVAGGLQPQGLEYPLTRGIPGDQINPSLALGRGGGWIVWQDAAIDGQGLGISALKVGENGSTQGSPRLINGTVEGDQENPSALLLPDGRLFCVWQGGQAGFQKVFGRFFDVTGSALTPDILISEGDGEHQIDPTAAVLADGSLVVAWSSYRQDGSGSYDVFGRVLSGEGDPAGDEFRINATEGLNRRSPALAPLNGGGFLAAWVSERQVGVKNNRDAQGRALAGYGAPIFAVNLVARAFDGLGNAVAPEAIVSDTGWASGPVLKALGDGNVYAAWTRRSPVDPASRYDVHGRLISPRGTGVAPEACLNVTTAGDQYRPRLAHTAHGLLAVWSSMGQDGSWEGVFGRWIDGQGTPSGDEIPINSQVGGGQILPAVATTGDSGMLVAYSSNQPRTGYELFAQRLAPLLLKVRASGNGGLRLSWPTVFGGVYQLQASSDARTWTNIGGERTASGEGDELAISAPGQMVLYRVVRVR